MLSEVDKQFHVESRLCLIVLPGDDKEICNMKKVFRCGYTLTLLSIVLAVCCGKLAAQPVSAQQNSPTVNFMELLRLAETKTAAKQWSEAAPLWEQVVEANPVEVRFWKFLADMLYQGKNYRKAIPAYERVIELRGGFPSGAAY